jgi:hypothetical protein
MFLLPRQSQLDLIGRIAAVLEPDGRFLFTAPTDECAWVDVMTGRTSQSLGKMTYKATIESAGLVLAPGCTDEGENHYYDVVKPSTTSRAV